MKRCPAAKVYLPMREPHAIEISAIKYNHVYGGILNWGIIIITKIHFISA